MSVHFGNLFRHEVLQDLHSFRGRVGLDVLIAPEQPPSAAAHLSMGGSSDEKWVDTGSVNLHLNTALFGGYHGLGRLSISTASDISGYAMLSHDVKGGRLSATASADGAAAPMLGLRASSRTVMLGAELPYGLPENVSAWMIGHVGRDVSVGVSGSLFKETAPIELVMSIDKRIPGTDSTYCVSTSIKSPSKEFCVGFSQHLVTHRKVYNPFEDKRVKFIANYTDLAIEAKAIPGKVNSTTISAGVSWQPNKNVLTKVHVSTFQGLAATLAVRNWWIPSVLTAVSVGVDAAGKPFVGGRLQVSNWLTAVEYEKGQPVSELPTTRWVSLDEVSRFDSRNKL